MKNRVGVLSCLLITLASAQWLERQVVIGDTFGGISLEGGIVVNPISGNVYIESDPVQIFNPVTKEKLRALDIPGSVVFCPASGKGYIFDSYGADSALIIDAAADTVVGTAVLPFIPDLFVYNGGVNRLYLVDFSNSEIVAFDPAGDSVLDTIDVGGTMRSVIVDSTRNRLYVGTDAWELDVVDCSLDTVVAEVEVDVEYLDMIAVSPATHKVYCAGPSDTALVVVSADSLRSVGYVQIDGELDLMVSNPVAARLYCARADTVFVVDCGSDTVRAAIPAQAPSIAVSSGNGMCYIGRGDSAAVLAVDTADNVVEVVRVPAVPSHGVPALTYWYGRNELYGVTSPGDLVFIIDASTDTIAGTVNYAPYLPRQMVHNPAGNKLYLLCPTNDELLVMDSTFGAPKRILGGVTGNYSVPVLNQALNRLYVVDNADVLRVIDCNTDDLLTSARMDNLTRPRPVLVPYLNKLYVFDGYSGSGPAYVYDCLRDTAALLFQSTDDIGCPVYDPRSNRVFFAGGVAPLCALDPVTDSIVKTFDLGNWSRANMAIDLDMGRLYFTHRLPDCLFTIDLLTDSVIASESLPWTVDSMYLNRRLGKMFMTSRDTTQVLVFDCDQGRTVGSFDVGHTHGAGLMNDRNDKLYLRYGVVVDCRYDSVVTRLDSFSPRCMAWDAIHNRVFQATTNWLYVYRDDPYGIEDRPVGLSEQRHATVIRGVLFLPQASGVKRGASSVLLDITGRKVLDLKPGANDVRTLPAGVYFVRRTIGSRTTKVVIQR